MSRSIDEQLECLSGANRRPRVRRRSLTEKLGRGRPLRIKYGCDPSAPDLHLGHTVPLDKLRNCKN